jgi:hypothetical protein
MPKIYESPDGGITVRARDFGDYENTITITTPSTITFDDCASNITKGTITVHDPYEETYERTRMLDKYPELKAKWEEYSELEKHYKAWDLLNKK